MAPPWFRMATPLYKNTGSVARDHLASERTFLAWMRTGLGFVALGIAIERFSQLDLSELIPDQQQQQHQHYLPQHPNHLHPHGTTNTPTSSGAATSKSPIIPAAGTTTSPSTPSSPSPPSSSSPSPAAPPHLIKQHLDQEQQRLDLARRHLSLRAEKQAEKQAEKHASQLQVGVLLSLGAGSILYGATRYFGNLRHLERGEFRPAYHGAAIVAAAVAGLAGGVYGSAVRRLGGRERERDGGYVNRYGVDERRG